MGGDSMKSPHGTSYSARHCVAFCGTALYFFPCHGNISGPIMMWTIQEEISQHPGYLWMSLRFSPLILSPSFLSYLIISYLILSYLIWSYLILSYLILSYLILSNLILSYLIFLILSYLFFSYLILSCLALPCLFFSLFSLLYLYPLLPILSWLYLSMWAPSLASSSLAASTDLLTCSAVWMSTWALREKE